MANKRYVKENNLVKAINTDSLELQKPLVNEYYDINIHNSNMDKIDLGYKQNKNDISNINYELSKTENTKYSTVNGIKEFSCKEGYVDNVVIEGETLVNLGKIITKNVGDDAIRTRFEGNGDDYRSRYSNNTFTLINYTDKVISFPTIRKDNTGWLTQHDVQPNSRIAVQIPNDASLVGVDYWGMNGWTLSNDTVIKDSFFAVLEGDHTDKPISYFEGLKSVGQGDKIDVLSYLSNTSNKIDLSNVVWKDGYYLANDFDTSDGRENMSNLHSYSETYIPIESNTTYLFKNVNWNFCFYDEYKQFIPTICEHPVIQIENISEGYFVKKTPINARYVRLVVLTKNKSIIEMYKDARYDKKTIPVTLRSLPNGVKDTIEKRGNKYVKVQRCGEVVLNENSNIQSLSGGEVSGYRYIVIQLSNYKYGTRTNLISDKFKIEFNLNSNSIFGEFDSSTIYINLKETLLASLDINGARTWLKSNPVTLVYELATPIITELPNFNPQTFEGDTTLLINSGVIQAEADFEVTNSIGSELEVLKGKVSDLDEDIQKAFQYGDNVKTQLVDKLISEGLNVSTNDTFENLINNIALGKKWASGTAVRNNSRENFVEFYNNGSRTTSTFSISVNGLDFKPSTVIITDSDGYIRISVCENPINATRLNYYAIGQKNSLQLALTSPASLYEGGFKLPVSYVSGESVFNCTWVAYE